MDPQRLVISPILTVSLALVFGIFPLTVNEVPAQDRNFKTVSIEPFRFTETLETTGELRPNRKLIIKSKLSEEVTSLPLSEGDSVERDALLLQFDTDLQQTRMSRARHQMRRAKHQKDIAGKNFNRKQSLHKQDLVSQSEFDQSKLEYDRARENYRIAQQDYREAQIQYSYTQVKSPFRGYLDEYLVEIGDQVSRGQPLIEFLQLNPLELEFEVTAFERKYLNRGDTVHLRSPFRSDRTDTTRPGTRFQGTLTTIKNDRNPNGLYTTKARFENENGRFSPGMTVKLHIPLRTIKNAVEIPLTYIDREGEQNRVVLFDPEKKSIHRRPIQVLDNRKDAVIVRLTWPSSWELVPGGIYTEIPKQFE